MERISIRADARGASRGAARAGVMMRRRLHLRRTKARIIEYVAVARGECMRAGGGRPPSQHQVGPDERYFFEEAARSLELAGNVATSAEFVI